MLIEKRLGYVSHLLGLERDFVSSVAQQFEYGFGFGLVLGQTFSLEALVLEMRNT
jgi:hypothetical protein